MEQGPWTNRPPAYVSTSSRTPSARGATLASGSLSARWPRCRDGGAAVLDPLESVPAQSRHAEGRPRSHRVSHPEIRQRRACPQNSTQSVADAAANVGLGFRQDLMLRTPNTLDAHRLIWLAGREGRTGRCGGGIVRRLFHPGTRYRRSRCAGRLCGRRRHGPRRGSPISWQAISRRRKCWQPTGRRGGRRERGAVVLPGRYGLFSGAMPAETMADALRQGNQILRQRAMEAAE